MQVIHTVRRGVFSFTAASLHQMYFAYTGMFVGDGMDELGKDVTAIPLQLRTSKLRNGQELTQAPVSHSQKILCRLAPLASFKILLGRKLFL